MSGSDPSDSIGLPWRKRTPQEKGLSKERDAVRRRGGRPHPGSGSGGIKHDGSSENEVIEVKTVEKTHTLKADYLESLYAHAVRQGKEPVYVVAFGNGIELVCEVRRRVIGEGA